jgi:hypothetical protein
LKIPYKQEIQKRKENKQINFTQKLLKILLVEQERIGQLYEKRVKVKVKPINKKIERLAKHKGSNDESSKRKSWLQISKEEELN